MKKSIFKKIGGLFLGLAMGLGVAVGVTAGNKAGEVKATTVGTAYTVSETAATTITNNGLYVLKQGSNGFAGTIAKDWAQTTTTASSYFILKAVGSTSSFTLEDYDGTNGYIYCSTAKKISWHASSKTTFKLMNGKKTTSISNAVGNDTVGTLQYNSAGGFRPYTGGTGDDAQLFQVTAASSSKLTYSYDMGSCGGTNYAGSTTNPSGGSTTSSPYTLEGAPTWSGYSFLGWNDGAETYSAGASYTFSSTKTVTFTAQWEQQITDWTYKDLTIAASADAKTEYSKDEEFDSTGLTVTLIEHSNTAGEDRNTDVTASATFTGFNSASAGTYNVKATYGGHETSNSISVTVSSYATDTLNRAFTGISSGSTSYSDWSDKTTSNGITYAGRSAGGNDSIQLRTSNSNEGVVVTGNTNGLVARKISVTWESHTSSGRKIDIYGSDTAYTAASNLYGADSGTLLGSISYDTPTELTITDDYEYIGIRSNNGALYLSEIKISWISPAVLTSIAVTTQPSKLTYVVGETFDATGMVVTGTYSDGSNAEVTDYSIDPDGALTLEDDAILVYVDDNISDIVEIDVTSWDSIVTNAANTNVKKQYRAGDEAFDTSNLVVQKKIAHSNYIEGGQPVTYTYETISSGLSYYLGDPNNGGTLLTPGQSTFTKGDDQSIYVSYTEGGVTKSASYEIDVDYSAVQSIRIPSDTIQIAFNEVDYDLGSLVSVYPSTANQDVTFEIGGVESDKFSFDSTEKTLTMLYQEGEVDELGGEVELTITVTSVGENISGNVVTTDFTIYVVEEVTVINSFDVSTGEGLVATQYITDSFELDLSGVSVTGNLSDGDSTNPDIEFDFEFDETSLVVGGHPVLTYVGTYPLADGCSEDIEITAITFAADFVKNIEFVSTTMKTSYIVGESWDDTGLSIKGLKASGYYESIEADSYTFVPEAPSVGTTSVAVTAHYGALTAVENIDVSVIALTLSSIEVTTLPTDRDYTLGDSFNDEGLVVTGHYNLSSKDAVLDASEYIISADMYTVNAQSVVTVTSVSNPSLTDTFTISVHVKQAEDGSSGSWNKVTSELDDWSGEYLVVYEESETSGLVWTGVDAGKCRVSATILNEVIETKPEGAASVTIESMTGGYSVKVNDGTNAGKYTSGEADSNKLLFNDTASANTISYDADNQEVDVISGRYLRYNTSAGDSNERFRYYEKSKQSGIQLYKFESDVEYDYIKIDGSLNIGTKVFYEGDPISFAYFTNVTVLKNDGKVATAVTSEEVTFTINPNGAVHSLVEGDNIVRMSLVADPTVYKDFEFNDVQKQNKVVDSITISEAETVKHDYYLDGTTPAWDYTGITITIDYSSDHETEELTVEEAQIAYSVSVSPSVPALNVEKYTISVELPNIGGNNKQTHDVSVSVANKAVNGINSFNFNKDELTTAYWEGDEYKTTGINSVTLSYNDGSTRNVQKADFDKYNIKIGLFAVSTDATPLVNATDGTEMLPAYDKAYIGVTCGSYKKMSQQQVTVTRLVHDIDITGDPKEVTKTSTITEKTFNDNNQTKTIGDVSYTLYNNGSYYGYDGTKGQQIGSGSTSGRASEMTLSTTVSGAVKSVTINTSGASSVNASVSVNVGGVDFKCDGSTSKNITSSAANYTFTGKTSSGNNEIVISWAQSSAKALYFKSITIVYDETNSVKCSNIDMTAQHAVCEFADYVNAQLASICGDAGIGTKALDASQAQGHTYRIDKTWSDIKAKYDSTIGVLDDSVELANGLTQKELAIAMLQNVVGEYDNEKAGAGCVEHAMAIYDHVYTLYGSYVEGFGGNFLSRNISAGSRINPILALNEVDNSVWVISAVALVGLTAIGGYFFYRKRKEI